MTNFYSFHGTVTMITDLIGQTGQEDGCNKLLSVANENGSLVNFVVSPSTYFVDHVMVEVGDTVTGYYDGNAPAILIYPPQYRAIVMVKDSSYYNVKVDYFNNELVSSDGRLRLNISPLTQMVLTNGQRFTKNPANRDLIVIYGPTTMSIPARTNPYKIIVLC